MIHLDALKKFSIFVNYRNKKMKNGSTTKIPLDSKKLFLKNCDISDPNSWSTYSVAKNNVRRSACDGIGIILSACDSIFDMDGFSMVGIDIDAHHCDRNPLAGEILEMFSDTYIERSPGGKGYHILCFMKNDRIPADYRKEYLMKNSELDIECYIGSMTSRYFTFTEDAVDENKKILQDETEKVLAFLDRYMRKKQLTVSDESSQMIASSSLPVAELLDRARQSRDGALFSQLYDKGDASEFPSESEARIRLCGMLAFWLGKDCKAVEEAYKASALYQNRPDKSHDLSCIEKAIDSCTSVYQNCPKSQTDIKDDQKLSDYKCLDRKEIYKRICKLDPDRNARFKDWSDISNAALFTEITKKEACFVPESQGWYVYDGKRWIQDLEGLKVMRLMQKISDGIGRYIVEKVIPSYSYMASSSDETDRKSYGDIVKEKKKIKASWASIQKRKNFLEDARSMNPVPFTEFDSDDRIFNVQNGTLFLQSDGEVIFRAHDPEDRCTKIADVRYDRNVIFPRWERFIDEIMLGNKEKIHFLQKIFGYSTSGDNKFECFFMFLGKTTRNGKSTLIDTVLNVYGDYATTSNAETVMMSRQSNASAPSEDLARLAGIRFLNVPEPAEGVTLNVAIVKRITGNDPITARFLHKNSFTYVPKFKFILTTNHQPNVTDQTLFSSDRINVITFEKHFGEAERDTSLKEMFASEEAKSAVLNWMLDGWKYLCTEGMYPIPECIKQATDEYKSSQDKIQQYIDDTFVIDSRLEAKSQTAYEEYKRWTQDNGYRALGRSKWRQAMIQSGYQFQTKRPSNSDKNGFNATTMIIGLDFKEDIWQTIANSQNCLHRYS